MLPELLIFAALGLIVSGVLVRRRAHRLHQALIAGGLVLIAWQATAAMQVAGAGVGGLGPVWTTIWGAVVTVIVWIAVALLWQGLRDRPLPRALCRRCGYDAHGVNADRCTECGRPFGRRGPRVFARRWPWLLGATALLLLTVVVVRAPHVRQSGWTGAIPDRVMLHGWAWLPERLVASWRNTSSPTVLAPRGRREATLYARTDDRGPLHRHPLLTARLERAITDSSSIRRVARASLLRRAMFTGGVQLNADQSASLVRAIGSNTTSQEILWLSALITQFSRPGDFAHDPIALHASTLRAAAMHDSEAGVAAIGLWIAVVGHPDEHDQEMVDRIVDLLVTQSPGPLAWRMLFEATDPRFAERLLQWLAEEESVGVVDDPDQLNRPASFLARMLGDGRLGESHRDRTLDLFVQLILHGEGSRCWTGSYGLVMSGQIDLLATVTVDAALNRVPADYDLATLVGRAIDATAGSERGLVDPVGAQRERLSGIVAAEEEPIRRAAAAALLVVGLDDDDPLRVEALLTLRRLRDDRCDSAEAAHEVIGALRRAKAIADDW